MPVIQKTAMYFGSLWFSSLHLKHLILIFVFIEFLFYFNILIGTLNTKWNKKEY